MVDVAVRLPFEIDFDILEVEDRYPSLQIAIAIREFRTWRAVTVRDTFWIAHSVWSDFLDRLASSSFGTMARDRDEIVLTDISQVFRLSIGSIEGAVGLHLSYAPPDRARRLTVEIVERIDDDTFGHIQRAFGQCPAI